MGHNFAKNLATFGRQFSSSSISESRHYIVWIINNLINKCNFFSFISDEKSASLMNEDLKLYVSRCAVELN